MDYAVFSLFSQALVLLCARLPPYFGGRGELRNTLLEKRTLSFDDSFTDRIPYEFRARM